MLALGRCHDGVLLASEPHWLTRRMVIFDVPWSAGSYACIVCCDAFACVHLQRPAVVLSTAVVRLLLREGVVFVVAVLIVMAA